MPKSKRGSTSYRKVHQETERILSEISREREDMDHFEEACVKAEEESSGSDLDVPRYDVDEDIGNSHVLDNQTFKRTVISMLGKSNKLLKDCESQIRELKNQVGVLTLSIQGAVHEPQRGSGYLKMFTDFPVKSEDELKNVETKLLSKEIHTSLVNALCILGGKDYKECTRRFMRRIIDDSLALQYSLQGHKQKKVFRCTRICSCILEAVHLCSGAQMKDIEVYMSTFLAKAKERLGRIDVSAGSPADCKK